MKNEVKTDRSGYLFDNKALLALIIPLIIEQLLAVLVGMADSIMIASVGEAAVSGVSLVDQIMVLLINLFGALATGGAVVAGQYLGQKNQKQACRAATQLVWFITVSAVVITVIVYACKFFILHGVFGRIEQDVMGHANTYLMIVTASIPFMALYNGGAAIFRAMGNSKVSMQVSIVMNIINVAGNALLIYGFHRGTEGVAIPTLVSRMVAAVLIIALLVNQTRTLHIEKTLRYRPDWRLVKKILSIGIPNGLENSMFQLGKILVLSLVSTFGTYAIAANAVSNAVALFQILPGMAMTLAATTVIARCVGAGDYEQVRYYNKKLIMITHICMVVTVGAIFLILPFILKAYHLSDLTAGVTKQILYFHGISAILIWPVSFILPATFRASGDAKACMYISILSMWIFRIIFSYILGKYMGLGVFGIWVAMVIDWIFRVICFAIRYFRGSWKKKAIV
ncbi:MATE family efflux transporter [[Clostridium] hylemonae]|uniref:Probable multidrug resistance protein NorM n=1 Tax=[Clostridium] hylemonae DSM 15053 TaxID=553973 RepID=C0C601_9FIRM|nr:MATE family efflux transporter [[Clostridium] hylemonae]EEG72535.1 MATE efflux family protein [[Clostridium] hylemonae DSM 15053]QEK16703.1 putative FMN/FAD exporter YeeO [[Clostridium] hylemonae DSM 15053]